MSVETLIRSHWFPLTWHRTCDAFSPMKSCFAILMVIFGFVASAKGQTRLPYVGKMAVKFSQKDDYFSSAVYFDIAHTEDAGKLRTFIFDEKLMVGISKNLKRASILSIPGRPEAKIFAMDLSVMGMEFFHRFNCDIDTTTVLFSVNCSQLYHDGPSPSSPKKTNIVNAHFEIACENLPRDQVHTHCVYEMSANTVPFRILTRKIDHQKIATSYLNQNFKYSVHLAYLLAVPGLTVDQAAFYFKNSVQALSVNDKVIEDLYEEAKKDRRSGDRGLEFSIEVPSTGSLPIRP